jgi:hypothetical protein
MPSAPLRVVVWTTLEGYNGYDVGIGNHGRIYRMTFADIMRLISSRNGSQQKRLEYKPK